MERELRTGISSGHFDWTDLEHAFRRVRDEWNFDVLEIWGEQVGFPPNRETTEALQRLSATHNVALSYHAPFVGDYDIAQKDASRSGLVLRELVTIAGRIHARYLIVHLGSNPDRASGLRCAMSAFSQNRDLIEKYNLTIGVEIVPRMWGHQVGAEIEDFELFFRTIDKPWVGLALDFGHAQMNGVLHDAIERLGSHIVYAHVQDTRGELDEHLGYGMGIIDWSRALAATLGAGFFGPYVIEYPESHGPEVTTKFLSDLRRLAAAANG